MHNDLKPENVLIDSDVDSKLFCVLTDFGISQIISDEMLQVKEFVPFEIRALSIAFAAPERLLYFRRRVAIPQDKENILSWDVFSFGVILYELLTGKIVGK